MIWPANEFIEYVEEEVEGLRRSAGIQNTHDAFLIWCLVHQFDLTEAEALRASAYSGQGDLQVDALWSDSARNRLTVVQAKTSDPLSSIESFGPEAAKDLWTALLHLRNPAGVRDPTMRRAMLEYSEGVARSASVELIALVSGNASPALERAIEELNLEFGKDRSAFRGHHASIVQLKNLNMRFYEALTTKKVGRVEIPLREVGGHWNYHPAFGEQAYVVDVDASVVGSWAQVHGYAVIAANLRYPLVSKYNDGIVATLSSPAERSKFWFYNNGLTVICDSVTHNHSEQNPALVLLNPQIVNGCQTAFTLGHFMDANKGSEKILDGVKVPVRVIQTMTRNGLALDGARIARFTNSQNAISSRDLRANDEVQALLQRRFEQRGYFYERKNGEWKAVRGVAGPRAHGGFRYGKVDNESIAQLALAFWLDMPVEAKTEFRLLFIDGTEGYYDRIFRPEVPALATAEDLILPHLAYNCLEEWRDKWLEEHPVRKRGETPQSTVLRRDVLKQGNLFLLWLVGRALRARYGVRYLAGGTSPDHKQVKAVVDALEAGERRFREDSVRSPLYRGIQAVAGSAMEDLYRYCKALTDEDLDMDVRKILIRKATAADKEFRTLFSDGWVQAQSARLPRL